MTAPRSPGDRAELPTFSECVVGYRSWLLDDEGQLWPLRGHRKPWQAAVNTARCDCGTSDRLHFEWSILDGRRVLEPAPLHHAPAESCTCGLYSVRTPRPAWDHEIAYTRGDRVAGAVASWGRIQVHGTGIRAERACVLALAVPAQADAAAVQKIQRAAARYGVSTVAFEELRTAAEEHGRPLPDQLHAAADSGKSQPAQPTPIPPAHWTPAPNAGEDEVDRAAAPASRPSVRPRHVFLTILALLAALIILLIAVDHRSTPCKLQILQTGPGSIERCAPSTTSTSAP